MTEKEKLDKLIRHIQNVREATELLGFKLLEEGKEYGKELIANGLIHDNSKFAGIEWLYLHSDSKENEPALFELATKHHIRTNLHHPEAWYGGISTMSELYLAECVCDWKARSSEFGNDLRGWIKDKATEKFNFTTQSRVYKDIKKFLDLLLDPEFK